MAMENLTLETNQSGCNVAVYPPMRMPLQFFYMAVIITAIPCNIFSLFVACQHISQRNELGVYLFNLALSDLALTVGLSLWLDFLWRQAWVHGQYVCLISVNIIYTNFYTCDAFLCCIALDRYLAVVHPFKYTFLKGKVGIAAMVSIAIWVTVLFFNTRGTVMELGVQNEKLSRCFDVIYPVPQIVTQVSMVRFFVGFVVPFLLVGFSTWRICKVVKSNQATEEQERNRILKLLTVILLCIFLCFGPVNVTMLLHTMVGDCRNAKWLFYMDDVSMAMTSLNCLADPLLYCFITETGKANVNQVVLFFQVKKRGKDEGVV
ncbi:psychosine receptor-like [Sparus aurata]|uniref:psychosine receptor-like n=1 Tax=Sparus aurata TaxID=8175 RepID=UPI0011C15AAF|nr:psychosine receptor-like [Sparus aurata]